MSETTRALAVTLERTNNRALRDIIWSIRREIQVEVWIMSEDLRMMEFVTERLFRK